MSSSREDFGIAIRSALLQRGARQKFSLFFLICISALIFFFDSYPNKVMDNTRSFLNDAVYRISSAASSPFRFASFIQTKTKDHFYIYRENKILKEELNVLRSKELNLKFLKNQNKSLEKILEIESDQIIQDSAVVAKVLLDKDSPFLKSIIINKGSKSGIKKGMPVSASKHLVGRVVEVNFLSSRVLLLNDLNSKIPVTIEPKGIQAILSGNGTENPILEYLPESYEIQNGNLIFTSGKDGIFNPGISIGTTEIQNEKILVNLLSDPNQINFVSITLESSGKVREF